MAILFMGIPPVLTGVLRSETITFSAKLIFASGPPLLKLKCASLSLLRYVFQMGAFHALTVLERGALNMSDSTCNEELNMSGHVKGRSLACQDMLGKCQVNL